VLRNTPERVANYSAFLSGQREWVASLSVFSFVAQAACFAALPFVRPLPVGGKVACRGGGVENAAGLRMGYMVAG
jgi:hypothetical protein